MAHDHDHKDPNHACGCGHDEDHADEIEVVELEDEAFAQRLLAHLDELSAKLEEEEGK